MTRFVTVDSPGSCTGISGSVVVLVVGRGGCVLRSLGLFLPRFPGSPSFRNHLVGLDTDESSVRVSGRESE